jgi:hypothetical protein
VRPFPHRPRWPLWSIPIYLLAADLVNTALSAILTFSDHVLYPYYLSMPRLAGLSAANVSTLVTPLRRITVATFSISLFAGSARNIIWCRA